MKSNLFCSLLILAGLFSFGCKINIGDSSESNTTANAAANPEKNTEQAEKPRAKTANAPDLPGNFASENAGQNRADAFSTEKPSGDGFEMRCGWYANPTPGNHWLNDADGEWIIGVQGGHQAEGDYGPEFKDNQWIKVNGNYGYGCACFRMKVDKKEFLVLEIAEAKARPLSACRNDPALRQPKE